MGLIRTTIEIINGEDLIMARKKLIGEDEIRRIQIEVLVDTGALHLAIHETLRDFLGLPVLEKRKAQLADGRIIEVDIVGPIELRFKNRQATVRAMVLPGDSEPLLGVIPMEDMDVILDPVKQEMVVNPDHPDMALSVLKGFRIL